MYMCIRSICIYPWLVKGPAKFRWICDVFLSRPTTCCGWWHMRKIVVVGCISLQLGLAILCFPFSTSHTWMLPIHGKQVVYNQHGSMLYLFNLFAACCNRLYNNLLFTAHPIKHQKLFAWNPCLACIYPLFFIFATGTSPPRFSQVLVEKYRKRNRAAEAAVQVGCILQGSVMWMMGFFEENARKITVDGFSKSQGQPPGWMYKILCQRMGWTTNLNWCRILSINSMLMMNFVGKKSGDHQLIRFWCPIIFKVGRTSLGGCLGFLNHHQYVGFKRQ